MKYKNGKYYCNDPDEMRDFFRSSPTEYEAEGTYPPDHTDPIFDERYQVILPAIAMESLKGLFLRGFNLTGVKEIDKEIPNTRIYPWITINEMIIVIENGYVPSLMNEDSAYQIYMAIEGYLKFWADRAYDNYAEVHNKVTVPDEDISLLKQLMDSLYPLIDKRIEKAPTGVLGGLSSILDIVAKPTIPLKIGNKDNQGTGSPYVLGAT